MSQFKGRHFTSEIILWAVHWHWKYGTSYRELSKMMEQRGMKVCHTTLYVSANNSAFFSDLI